MVHLIAQSIFIRSFRTNSAPFTNHRKFSRLLEGRLVIDVGTDK